MFPPPQKTKAFPQITAAVGFIVFFIALVVIIFELISTTTARADKTISDLNAGITLSKGERAELFYGSGGNYASIENAGGGNLVISPCLNCSWASNNLYTIKLQPNESTILAEPIIDGRKITIRYQSDDDVNISLTSSP